MREEATIRVAAPSDQSQILAAYAAWDRSRTISPDDVIYMLEIGPELTGMVRRTYEYGLTMLRGMCIAPKMRGQGLGLDLLKAFVSELNGESCYCLPYTHLVGFYGNVGFVSVSEHEIPSFLQERLVEYRARGLSVFAMYRPSQKLGSVYAG